MDFLIYISKLEMLYMIAIVFILQSSFLVMFAIVACELHYFICCFCFQLFVVHCLLRCFLVVSVFGLCLRKKDEIVERLLSYIIGMIATVPNSHWSNNFWEKS